jgi:hypothetical protein
MAENGRELFGRVILGLIFVALGLMVIFVEPVMDNFWVMFIWIPGLIMEFGGFKKKQEGLLVPGGILLMVALTLTLDVLNKGFISSGGWTLFVLAPAVGLFQLYLFTGRKNTGLLVPVTILTAIAVVFAVTSFTDLGGTFVIGFVLIIAGAAMMISQVTRRGKKKDREDL